MGGGHWASRPLDSRGGVCITGRHCGRRAHEADGRGVVVDGRQRRHSERHAQVVMNDCT